MVAAPVVHYIGVAPILLRHATAFDPAVIRARAAVLACVMAPVVGWGAVVMALGGRVAVALASVVVARLRCIAAWLRLGLGGDGPAPKVVAMAATAMRFIQVVISNLRYLRWKRGQRIGLACLA